MNEVNKNLQRRLTDLLEENQQLKERKHSSKMKALWIVLAIAIILVAVLLSSGCVTTQPVPDTRPSYYQLAKQAEKITNAKQ